MNTSGRQPEEIFGQALGITDPAERQAFLEQACGGDAALRQEVESLLTAISAAGDFLRHPCPAVSGSQQNSLLKTPLSETAGTWIGRYKLLEQIGEGGFGVVWMAEQEEPVRRRVALKIIKAGMDTKEVIARFEAERQALALMDHPNIARILDAGATPTGRPYFAMELIDGLAITEYCDREKLSTQERLRLFIKVCQAVQHAHQKGIIHRDLKPTNVLVMVHDAEPVPKVIDFGVAKALGQKLTERTLLTASHHFIGTPAYMSPEQADLGGFNVDTRTDIYALGVLLYELLTGVTPLDRDTLGKAALDEIRRIIREREPPKPSTRLGRMPKEHLAGVAARRRVEPAKLGRLIRGDLDWIVMKALEKEHYRRYQVVIAFTQDLERHLRNEPVSAAAPGLLYTTTKFIRRHRTPVAASVILFSILAAGFGVGVRLSTRATNAERDKLKLGSFLRESIEQRVTNTLSIDDRTKRRIAIGELRENMPEEAHEVIVSLLTSPDQQLRRRAGVALIYFGSQNRRKAEALAAQLTNNTDSEIRLCCASVLMSVPGSAVDRAYEQALFDPSEKVAQLACNEMVFRANSSSSGALFLVLTNRSWSVRHAACVALIRQKAADTRVVATLEALAREPEAEEYARTLATFSPALQESLEKTTGEKLEDTSLENLLKQALDQANTKRK